MKLPLLSLAGIIIGSVLVIAAMALAINSYTDFEAEDGSLSQTASVVDDDSASNAQAIKFGTGGAEACEGGLVFGPGSHDPWDGCWPGDGNTGVPENQSLTVVNGDQVFDSSYDGQTISNREFRGFVRVTGSNITFVNCWFRGGTATGTNRLLNSYGAGPNIVVMDSDFAPMNPSVHLDGIRAENTTIIRSNISGVVDGVKAGSNVTIRDSYIHDMSWYASDPKQGGGQTHNDGVQILNGTNIQLIHNTIVPAGTYGSNAAIQITQDQGAVSDVLIERNNLDYGGCTLNIAHTPLAALTGVSVRDNRFGRNQRFANCAVKLSSGAVLAQYSANMWGDTGTPIPPPQ